MELNRYNKLREDLIDGYTKIMYRPYRLWIAPKSLMSIEQIRERETLVFEGAEEDDEFFTKQAPRSMTMWGMVKNLNNLEHFNDLSFQRPNTDIVDIYETIQTYILNWCTIVRQVPEYGMINLNELKTLENLAYVLFDRYKRVKPFVVGYKQRQENLKSQQQDQTTKDGLVGLAILLSRQSLFNSQNTFRSDDDEFVSHVDDLKMWLQNGIQAAQPTQEPIFQSAFHPVDREDSIAATTDTVESGPGLMEWYQNRG